MKNKHGNGDLKDITYTRMSVAELEKADYNPRTISSKAMKGLSKSIDKFGLVQPIVYNKRTSNVVAGHQRLDVLTVKNVKEVDVAIVDLSETDEKALNISLNNPYITGQFTPDVEELLNTIHAEAPELMEALNFEELLAEIDIVDKPIEGFTDPDDVPDAPEEPTSKLGDLYKLGEHRLLCGDATKSEDVERLMDGKKGKLFATDPPYGVAYGVETGSKKYKAIENDENNGERLQQFLECVFCNFLKHIIPNCAWYLWHAQLTQGFFAAAAAADVLIHRQIIWVKPSLIMGHGDYHWRHELCFYGWIKGNRPDWYGDRKQDTIWEIGRENDKIHPTQKPVEIFIKPIKFHTKTNDICVEPFAGSGSQVIACEQTKRKCYMMEIDPVYCDVIVKRWEEFTGQKAEKV